MPIVIPHRVSSVLRRRRLRFFQANPVNDSWEDMALESFLMRTDIEGVREG